MARTREKRKGRLSKKSTKRMKAKAATRKAEISLLREEMALVVAAMGEMKLELDLFKAALRQQSEDVILISQAVDSVTHIVLQL